MGFCISKKLYKNFAEDFFVFLLKNVGEFFEKINKPVLAAKIYQKAVNVTERDEIFYHKIADICVKRNKMESAVECYKRVLEANPKNRDVLINWQQSPRHSSLMTLMMQ